MGENNWKFEPKEREKEAGWEKTTGSLNQKKERKRRDGRKQLEV